MKSRNTTKGRWPLKAAMILSLTALVFVACDINNNDQPYYPSDHQAPPVPTGVTSTTMDQAVLVSWNPVVLDPSFDDLAGYKVYRSNDNSLFNRIATVGRNTIEYTDEGLINGHTYFYAVSSFDNDGNESALSSENVFDTPRPEGFNFRIYVFDDPIHNQQTGFDLSGQTYVPWNSQLCDFFAEYDTSSGAFFLWLGHNSSRIQDMGFTNSFDDITYAPSGGWSQFDYAEIVEGHTYVILTGDNHYAKIRVTALTSTPSLSVIFDWGYQVDPGNRELRIEPTTRIANPQAGTGVQ